MYSASMINKLRMTPQTNAVLAVAQRLGHGTNQTILVEVRKIIPDLSATTVHRITNRLISAGILANGPEVHGVRLVDANTMPHDHFMCSGCDGIKDIKINPLIRSSIKKEAGIKVAPKTLTIYGDCDTCI